MNKTTNINNWSLFWTFLKIGSYAFGGFMSLVAIVESIIVEEKKWLKQETILDGISLASILPGPVAVNVVTFIGYKINGLKGAIAAFLGIIIPSFIMILLLCDLYLKYNETAMVKSVFQGIMIAVAAIIFQVSIRMAKKTLDGKWGYILAAFAFVCLFISPKSIQLYSTFAIILVYGCIGYFSKSSSANSAVKIPESSNFISIVLPLIILAALLLISLLPIPWRIGSLEHLFVQFSGLGLMLFGGGYVFIPMIQELVVSQYQWMSQRTFIDAIALGQITPGPIVITIAFVGYKVNGILGAIISTLAIFGSPAILMVVASNLMEILKRNAKIKNAMQTIRTGVIGMIFYAGIIVLQAAFQNTADFEFLFVFKIVALLTLCFVMLLRFKLSIQWVIPIAGLLGYLIF